MNFGEKLLQLRKAKHLTQSEVAKAIGITTRSYTDYEHNIHYPQTRDRYKALAKFFNVDVNYFYTENEKFIDNTGQWYNYCGRQQADALVDELAKLFAGDELSDEDKVEVMMNIQRVYWLRQE